jgi:hypothetical protein
MNNPFESLHLILSEKSVNRVDKKEENDKMIIFELKPKPYFILHDFFPKGLSDYARLDDVTSSDNQQDIIQQICEKKGNFITHQNYFCHLYNVIKEFIPQERQSTKKEVEFETDYETDVSIEAESLESESSESESSETESSGADSSEADLSAASETSAESDDDCTTNSNQNLELSYKPNLGRKRVLDCTTDMHQLPASNPRKAPVQMGKCHFQNVDKLVEIWKYHTSLLKRPPAKPPVLIWPTPGCTCTPCSRRKGIETAEMPLLCTYYCHRVPGEWGDTLDYQDWSALVYHDTIQTSPIFVPTYKYPYYAIKVTHCYKGDWTVREVRALLWFLQQYTHVKLSLLRSCPEVQCILQYRPNYQCLTKVKRILERSRKKLTVAQLNNMSRYEHRVTQFHQYLVDTDDSISSETAFDFEAFRKLVGPPIQCFEWYNLY